MDLYNDRRLSPYQEGDDARFPDKRAKADANSRIRASQPAYRQDEINTRIRTAAVQLHRAAQRGQATPGSVSEYINFVMGTNDAR